MTATLPEAPPASIPNYRRQVRDALPAHYFKPDLRHLFWIPFHAAIIAAGLYALSAHFSWWFAPFLAIVIGHSFASLGFVAHEIAHGATIRRAWMRDLLAGLCFSPYAIGPHLWRRWHNADHHNNTQIEGVDPDHLLTMEEYKHNKVLRALYRLSPTLRNLVIFGSFSFRMTQHQLNMVQRYGFKHNENRRETAIILIQLAIPAIAWVGGTLLLGTQVFWWGYAIPMLVANFVAISYIATNHFLNPLADERDVLASSLTVTLPRWLSWLDAMHVYFGAHVAHHLFPNAPTRYARAIEAEAERLFPDRYYSMSLFKALRLLWQTPWVYEDNATLYDPQQDVREPTLGHGLERRP